MAFPLPWPASLVPSAATPPHLQNRSRGGGPSSAGSEQRVVVPGGGRWTQSLTIGVHTRDQVLDLRALILGLDGQAGTVLVPAFDGARAPWVADAVTGALITPSVAARDALLDPAYAANPETSAVLDFRLGAAVSMNATEVVIRRQIGGRLRPGMLFSLGGRLHAIVALGAADPGGSALVSVRVAPWLRADQPIDAIVEFARPTSLMRLASDDVGRIELDLLRTGRVTLDFVEAF